MATNSSEYMKKYYLAHRETIRQRNNEYVRRFRQRHAEELKTAKKNRAKQLLADGQVRAEEYFNGNTE